MVFTFKKIFYGGILLMSLVAIDRCSGSGASDKPTPLAPPVAATEKTILEIHGESRVDNYYWMRLTDDQKNASTPDEQTKKVLAYLQAENAYTDSMLAPINSLKAKLYDEMVGRLEQDEESLPVYQNGYYYYSRYEEGQDYALECRKKENLDAVEEVMLNGPELATGLDYFDLSIGDVSKDNRLLIYGVDTLSRRIYDLRIKDLTTGKLLPDLIPATVGEGVWANDSKTLFYVTQDELTLRSNKVFRHTLGSPASEDVLVFEETDEQFNCGVWKTKSSEYITIQSHSTESSEIRFLKSTDPTGQFRVFQPREPKLHYEVHHAGGDFFYIITDHNAPNNQLMKCTFSGTSKEKWISVIPHSKEILIETLELFRDYMVVQYRRDGQQQFDVHSFSDKSVHTIAFDETAFTIYPHSNSEPNSSVLRFGYESLTTPSCAFDYDLKTKSRTLMKATKIMDPAFDPKNYQSERHLVKARDGAMIPITLVYKKGLKLNGKNPLYLTGYGSYGYSSEPDFSSVRLSLLDRGFVFATAHIRGGQEMGRHWYDDGRLLKKKNTFNDFIDCAEYLIEKKFTSSAHLYAAGGSAGGLLMGAVVNMRLDLFNGVLAAVPFVDVVTTMLDASIPLTTGEYDEWGNPAEKEYYDYMKSYSPYDNIKAQNYPNILITTGFWDSQVQYWEPAKWCALLRATKTDDNLLLMRCAMDAGHGGASGRFESLKESAEEYAFFFMLEGITE